VGGAAPIGPIGSIGRGDAGPAGGDEIRTDACASSFQIESPQVSGEIEEHRATVRCQPEAAETPLQTCDRLPGVAESIEHDQPLRSVRFADLEDDARTVGSSCQAAAVPFGPEGHAALSSRCR